jgi:ketosteroid isomerase-like protein
LHHPAGAFAQRIFNPIVLIHAARWGPHMIITPDYAESFFGALATRDPLAIAPFVADEAEWLIVGPIELFPSCGQHLGKDAVLAAYQRFKLRSPTLSYVREFLVTDGTSASALSRFTALLPATGKQITVRIAQFARFRHGKVIEFCAIIDTLGAAEQVLGRSLVSAEDAPALVE